ncbi:ABC transporter ATP-binding protein [Salinigranum salinum]|uniref:ABC transporter ATP-binding protein n=1 Tax=Salinigranum salinum TaxID=1364937 RepID=UPI001260DED8|nr:ABC transporter ATP-binding protein [Salinigranum salinum]
MTELELDSVTKVFGDPDGEGVVAVDDVSLTVDDGEFLVLLGPSGCGKTTTLRMIGGLEMPTSGTISFDGVVVNDVKARNRDVAMVFQDFALYPHMDVRRNLGFGLRREKKNLSDEEINSEIEAVAEMLEIEALLNNKPSALSGGQKQRVALGRAIIREPRLFLFDEPLANLDAKLRKTMRTEIDELQSKVGITSVYVTHNQEEAMSIADKIAVMNGGELQQLGTPSEVFNEPTNLFVAQFVGSPDMNLFDATLIRQGDSYRVDTGTLSFDLPAALVDTDAEQVDARIGFRPQDLYQRSMRRTDGPEIEATVRVVEPLGTEAVLYADTSETDITALVSQFHDLGKGDEVTLTIAPEHIYAFEATTERLLKGRLMTERAESEVTGEVEV